MFAWMQSRWGRLVLVAFWILLTITLRPVVSHATSENQVVMVDSVGSWSLGDLGAEKSVINELSLDEQYVVAQYRLPKSVNQGDPLWYLGKFHFRLHVGDMNRGEKVYVSAFSGKYSFAQIVIERYGTDRDPTLYWTTTGLVDGVRHFFTKGNVIETIFYNYLQLNAVTSGTKDFTVTVESDDQVKVDKLEVLDGSGILASNNAPPAIMMNVDTAADQVVKGMPLDVRATLEVDGGVPAKGVSVRAIPSDPTVKVLGDQDIKIPNLSGEQDVKFRAKFTDSGQHELLLRVGSENTNSTEARLIATIGKTTPIPWLDIGVETVWRLAVFVAVVIAAFALLRVRKA